MTGLIILVIIIVIALLFLISCIKIVPQAKALVIERLGCISGNMECRTSF